MIQKETIQHLKITLTLEINTDTHSYTIRNYKGQSTFIFQNAHDASIGVRVAGALWKAAAKAEQILKKYPKENKVISKDESH
jgi:hypothetical protein